MHASTWVKMTFKILLCALLHVFQVFGPIFCDLRLIFGTLVQNYLRQWMAGKWRCTLPTLTLGKVKVDGVYIQWKILKNRPGDVLVFLCLKDCAWAADEESRMLKA